jgi:DNA-binding transcriptional regulator YhcF (GntR family)
MFRFSSTMHNSSSSNIHQRTMSVYRDMIRFLGEKGAEEGYRLPTQDIMVRNLKTCHATLQVAMKWLVEDGVLSRTRKKGTFVLQPYPTAPKRAIWRTGIVMPSLANSAFLPLLTHFLHQHLSHQGAAARAYFLSPKAAPSAEVVIRRDSEFLGLAEDIRDGLLDGIVTATRLRCPSLPVSSAGVLYDQSGFGAVYDEEFFMRTAIDFLETNEAKRVFCHLPFDLAEIFPSLDETLAQIRTRLETKGGTLEVTQNHAKPDSGRHLAQRLLERHPSLRPQGIVIQSETQAQMFCNTLAATSYRPFIVTQTNKQIPTTFALPVHELAIDVEEVAACAVRLLIEKLRRPSQAGITLRLKHHATHPESKTLISSI